jgi:hypothetical protein
VGHDQRSPRERRAHRREHRRAATPAARWHIGRAVQRGSTRIRSDHAGVGLGWRSSTASPTHTTAPSPSHPAPPEASASRSNYPRRHRSRQMIRGVAARARRELAGGPSPDSGPQRNPPDTRTITNAALERLRRRGSAPRHLRGGQCRPPERCCPGRPRHASDVESRALGSRPRKFRMQGRSRFGPQTRYARQARTDSARNCRVGERRLDRAARAGLTDLVSSRRRIDPCMRFSRTRLSDVLHRRHSAISLARAGGAWARRRFPRG